MAGKIVSVPLPHDLPENWNDNQYVSPEGTEVGLTEQHGYNYLMKQVNATQQAAQELDSAVGDLVGVNLLNNAYFVKAIDRNNGYVVPKGTLGYSDTACTVVVGSVQEPYRKAYYVNTSYGYVIGSDGVSFYVKYEDMVRGYVGSGYGIDNWRSNNAATYYLIEADGLRINMFGGSRFYQTVQLPAGTYTFTILADYVDGAVLGIELPVGTFTPVEHGIATTTFTLTEATSLNIYISSVNGGTSVLKAAKLEVGAHQTLASQAAGGNWAITDPPNMSYEISKCMTYQTVSYVTSTAQIDSAILGWIAGMSEPQTRNFVLNVEALNLGLDGGVWFITINKASPVYATVIATRYDLTGMLLRCRSVNNNILTDWASVSYASVLDASVE